MQMPEDREIVALFLQRNQQGIAEAARKYGSLCTNMAANILGSRQDAEECVNDAMLQLWESIPPAEPENLGGYLLTICRRKALDRKRWMQREKRGSGQKTLVYEEMAECLAAPEQPESAFDAKALSEAIGRFLDTEKAEVRVMFMLRYWACLSIEDVAEECSVRSGTVRVTLLRTRNKLRKFLEQEGYL